MSSERISSAERGGPAPSACRGFTLIEVLIALSVLAVTMTATFSMFSTGMKLRSATRDRMAFDRDARLLVSALTDDFANLIPSAPAPRVSPDAIILCRYAPRLPGGKAPDGLGQLVTYQWSGSVVQESLFVRMTAPLPVDFADSDVVLQEFLKWTDDPTERGDLSGSLVRDDPGAGFGSRASRNGLSGSWVAYPTVWECVFRLGAEGTEGAEDQERVGRSGLRLNLCSRPTSSRVPDRILGESTGWRHDGGVGLELMLWVPRVEYRPGSALDYRRKPGWL